jgi:lysozyme
MFLCKQIAIKKIIQIMKKKQAINMRVSDALIDFIKMYESLHDGDLSTIGLQPKLCPGGYWTVGYGHVITVNGKPLKAIDYPRLDDYIRSFSLKNEKIATALLKTDIVRYENIVITHLGSLYLKQHEFDALVSHTYNTGGSETLFEYVDKYIEPDTDENLQFDEVEHEKTAKFIKNWFLTRYITSNGIELQGLKNRRKDECEMFFNADYKRNY